MTSHAITTEDELRALYGFAQGGAVTKLRPSLDKHSRHFLSLSPFMVLSTAAANGKADVSPRGDPPGFAKVIDDKHILVADRPGNNRLDTLVNIVQNPNVACLFVIPGIEDTLRIAGRAHITTDPQLLQSCSVEGKQPKSAMVIAIDEVFLHCAKAFRRSRLWDNDYRQPRSALPSLAQMILEQVAGTAVDETTVKQTDAEIEENYHTEMY